MEISSKISNCLSTDAFLNKYEIVDCIGYTFRSHLLVVREKSTAKLFAAKISCPPTVHEYEMATLITRNKNILRNVTTIHDCAILNHEIFIPLFNSFVTGKWSCRGSETHKLSSDCDTPYFAMIMELVDTTFWEVINEKRNNRWIYEEKGLPIEVITTSKTTGTKIINDIYPYHLFELYYAILELLLLGIIPVDVHAGNVGLVNEGTIKYRVCNCVVEFPPGLHVKLIDYGQYYLKKDEEEEEEKKETKEEKKEVIEHGKVLSVLKELKFKDYIIPTTDFPSNTLFLWNKLFSLPRHSLALDVLVDMAVNYFGCSKRTETSAAEVIPEVITDERVCADILSHISKGRGKWIT